MGVNIVCTLLLPGSHDESLSVVAIFKINSCYASYAISVTLRCTFGDVNNVSRRQ